MALTAPARVCWIFSEEDEPIARELLDMAAVLEVQDLVKNWSLLPLPVQVSAAARPLHLPSRPVTAESIAAAESSDVVMLLASPASLGYFSVSNIDALVQRTRLVL